MTCVSLAWKEEIKTLIEERLGLVLSAHRGPTSLERFVAARVSALHLKGADAYVRLLERGTVIAQREISRLTSVVTNGQTSFFRDSGQWRAIATALKLTGQAEQNSRLFLWSAGCATGEEAYSLAMLCQANDVPARIVATDVNIEALKVARDAYYDEWRLRNVSSKYLNRYVTRCPDGRLRVTREIRTMVQFGEHNLALDPRLRPKGEQSAWNVILCQNVFVHWRPDTVEKTLPDMLSVLDDTGYLFLSTTEALRYAGSATTTKLDGRLVFCAGPRGRHRQRWLDLPTSLPAPVEDEAPPTQHPAPWSSPEKEPAAEPTMASDYRGIEKEPAAEPTMASVYRSIEKGDLDRARAELEAYVTAHPHDAVAQVTLGNLALRMHDFDTAMNAYDNAQSDAPLLAEVHFCQGVLNRKLGNLEVAEQALRRALFLDPDFWPAAFLLAGIYDRWGRGRPRRRELRRTVELLSRPERGRLFSAHPCGLKEAGMPAAEIDRLCRRELARRR